jgi:ketosteroid isomerase-like protein
MTNRLLLGLFCIFFYVNIQAQPAKKEIESSVVALTKAMLAADRPALEKLTAEELSYGHSTGAIEDKTVYIKNILAGSPKFSDISSSDQTISQVGDISIVRNVSSFKGTKADGTPLDIKIGVLMVWKKSDGDWRLIARQGYKLPQ